MDIISIAIDSIECAAKSSTLEQKNIYIKQACKLLKVFRGDFGDLSDEDAKVNLLSHILDEPSIEKLSLEAMISPQVWEVDPQERTQKLFEKLSNEAGILL
ncbi:MAG: hypothetical protein GY862_34725, partial [Gammaproteobacteria bacterium]|nr:hypothetical protein [Gammaproteobacteria bacterium]